VRITPRQKQTVREQEETVIGPDQSITHTKKIVTISQQEYVNKEKAPKLLSNQQLNNDNSYDDNLQKFYKRHSMDDMGQKKPKVH